MGVFARLGDLLKANINDIIDKAEDPEKMVKQIIADMQKELTRATQNYGKAKASERLAETKYKEAVSVSSNWENKARAALARGEQDLAKEALSRKVKADEEVASYKEMFDSISTQTDAIGDQVELLKAKLEEAKSRQAMLIARAQMADTKKQLAQSQGNFDGKGAFEKLTRMEEKVQQKEAEADAFTEIAGVQQDDLQQQFAQIENDAKVDAELQRLIAEMNGNAAPEEITPEAAPVDNASPDAE
ncbi:MAG: PspA/IM30 family protein [Ruminococcus sp.]|nr:PspA/IM30 family protein [Ruminococcus sp.]